MQRILCLRIIYTRLNFPSFSLCNTTIACANGPNVNLLPTNFSFQNPFFAIQLNFQWQRLLKTQHLLLFKSTNFQTTFIKTYSSKAFKEYQHCCQDPLSFLVLILTNFQWKNCSVFNNFSTITWNSMKPTQCTLLIKGFPRVPRAWQKGTMV
jgi:hypothetical protein